MSRQYTGFIYQWTNQVNGKKYIGSHCGLIDDGYIGSGLYFKRAYQQHPERFVRTILEYIDGDKDEILSREQYYLSLIPDITTNKEYYNISPNAGGGSNHSHLTDDERKGLYKKWHDASMRRLAEMTDDERTALANRKKATWDEHIEIKERHAVNTRQRRLLEESEKSNEEKELFKQKMQDIYWSRDPLDILQQHRAQSNGVKNWHQTKDPAIEEQRINNMKETKKLLNLKYIYHPITLIRKQVPQKELHVYIDQGWSLGMGPRSNRE
jgi:hypothetical protein